MTRTYFVTADPDVLGVSVEAETPETAAEAALGKGDVVGGIALTVRWDVRPGPTPGSWRSARLTTVDLPAAVAAPKAAPAARPAATLPATAATDAPQAAQVGPAV